MVAKLFQHVLLWLAASASIVLGASWGSAVGFTSHRLSVKATAWAGASAAVIFAAALVQRAPAAIVTLLAICVVVFVFGVWLVTGGARAVGLGYMTVGAIYIAGLVPTCLRWLRGS